MVVKKRPGVRRGRVLGVGGPRVFQHRGGGGAEHGGEVTRPGPAPGLDIAGLGRLLLLAEGEWVVVLGAGRGVLGGAPGPGLVLEAARLRGAEVTLAWPRCRARRLVLLQLRWLMMVVLLLLMLLLLSLLLLLLLLL